MKEKYETPDIEIVKLDAEIETTDMIKESNEKQSLLHQIHWIFLIPCELLPAHLPLPESFLHILYQHR